MRLLVTGFGPYPGVPANPTAILARRLARDRRLARLGMAVQARVFETTYAGCARLLPAALAEFRPEACLHLGLAPRAKRVRIEARGENRARPLSPDAAGRRPVRRRLVPGGPDALATPLPVAQAVERVRRAGVPAGLSRDAGAYLCNAVYYLSLADAAAGDPARPVLFVHVPRPAPAPGRMPARRMRRRPPSMDALARALAEVAILLAAEARKGVTREGPPA